MLRRVTALLAIACAACSGDETHNATSGGGGEGGVGGEDGAAGALPDVDLAGTIREYGYRFDIATGAATSTLTVDVESAGNCFVVPDDLAPESASINGAPAEASLDAGVLRVCGQSSIEAGESFEIGTTQTVPLQNFLGLDVGFNHYQNLAAGTFSYLLSWVGGCDHFGPCDDRTDALVRMSFQVTHPDGTTVLCPGALTAGATETSCTLAGSSLAPTYSGFGVAADTDWVRSPFTTGGGVSLVLYETPVGDFATTLDPVRVGAMLDWITQLLGAYPYGDEIRVASGPTNWLGFEHPANIVLHERLPYLPLTFGDPTMHVLTHEIAHQWAGDRVTLADRADFVWKEAIAEYLAYVFEDEQGPVGAAASTRQYWDDIATYATFHPRPMDEPTPAVEVFYGDVYGAGPMVLFLQLEPWLGRSGVLAAIASFLSEAGAKSVTDLQAALQAEASVDLGPYFEAWVYGAGAPAWPPLSVTTVDNTTSVDVTVSFDDGVPRPCVVEVDVQGASATVTATLDFGPDPQVNLATTTVALVTPIVGTAIDPRHRLVQAPPPGAANGSRPRVWMY